MLSHAPPCDIGIDPRSLLDELSGIVERGGPVVSEYASVATAFQHLRGRVDSTQVLEAFKTTLVPECIHGWGCLKPYGYAGDHVIIDRIYTEWVSDAPYLKSWDEFFHAQAAPRAVRNRKEFFRSLVRGVCSRSPGPISILNVGSGPGRDVLEFSESEPEARVHMTSVDNSPRAIAYASTLCQDFLSNVTFKCVNALRFRPVERFDLIWSAGLFDYCDDRQFVSLGRRLLSRLKPGGELVIGNFATGNPSRAYMELLGRWYLQHRSAKQLHALGMALGMAESRIQIDAEPEGVNLFLRIHPQGP